MRDVDGCSRLGVANFGHRWHHDFGSRRTVAVPGLPRGGQRVAGPARARGEAGKFYTNPEAAIDVRQQNEISLAVC